MNYRIKDDMGIVVAKFLTELDMAICYIALVTHYGVGKYNMEYFDSGQDKIE